MNGPGDIPLSLSSSVPDNQPCGIISIIPALGMSSCRGRAEAFARRLSSKLRTLGSQTDDEQISPDEERIINGTATNTWTSSHDSDSTVTDLQPLRHESDSFFDFDCELESPGSPVDECEYLRLIETASNTPHNSATESGYVCASAASSQSSTDAAFLNTTGSNDEITLTDDINAKNITAEIILPPSNPECTLKSPIPPNEQNNHCVNGHATINGDSLIHMDSTEEIAEKVQNNKDRSAAPFAIEANTDSINENGNESLKKQHMIVEELQKLSEERNGITVTEEGSDLKNTSNQSVSDLIPKGCDEVILVKEELSLRVSDTINSSVSNNHNDDILRIEIPENTQVLVASLEISPDQVKDVSVEGLLSEMKTNGIDDSDITAQGVDEVDRAIKKSTPPPVDTTDDEDDCRPQRVRRCSSLKTGKTPPGTPGRKKIVRFADVLGLDLADVKTFLDEVPTIPKSAFEDLEIMEAEPPIQLGPKSDKLLMPLFQQPGGLPTFLDVVRDKQVSLENAAVTDNVNQTITGSVRVRNLDFHKSVHIRYSLDGWRSFADLQANYVQNSCDGFSDKFTFLIFGNTLQIGQRIEFAVRFQCKGQQFWDNNYGANYCFQCLPSSTSALNNNNIGSNSNSNNHAVNTIVPSNNHQTTSSGIAAILSPTVGEAWCSSFY